MTAARRTAAAGSAAALTALLAAAPTPVQAVATLQAAGGAPEPTAPLVAVLALLAWPLALWLGATVLLTVVAHRSGAAGRLAAVIARRTAPAAVRRAVELALGLTVVVGGVGSPALAADAPTAPAPAPVGTTLDWPGTSSAALDWPTAPAPEAPEPPATSVRAAPVPAAGEVVVRPGDTLWDLAEQRLAERDGGAPSVAQVAAAWPSWWAANREAVGDDPHLLHPGTPLAPPADPS